MATTGTFSGDGLGFGLTFTLHDNFSGASDKIQGSFSKLKSDAQNLGDKVNSVFTGMQAGFGMVATGVALAAPLGMGLKVAAEFETMEIGLTTLLKSSSAAKTVMRGAMEDAAATPFGTKEILMVNKALITTGLSAAQARMDTLGLANAIAGTGGGNDELARMAVNMQQIRNSGKATSADIKQFAYAGIPIYTLIGETLGITAEKAKDVEVSYDVLTKSFEHAAAKGGMFEGALKRMSESFSGKTSTLIDEITFSMKAFGDTIMEYAHPAIDAMIGAFRGLSDFMQTRAGKVVAQIVGIGIAIVALTVILIGLNMVLGAVQVMLVSTFGPVLLPIIATLAVLISVFAVLNGAVEEFKEVLGGTEKVETGVKGFAQRVGGVLYGLSEIWNNFDVKKGQSGMTRSLINTLYDLGIYELVKNLGTWLIRIKALFHGMWEGIKEVWGIMKQVAVAIWDAIKPFLKFTGILNANTSDLQNWLRAGKILGYVIGTSLVTAFIALTLSMIPIAIILGTIIFALWGLWRVGRTVFGGIQVAAAFLVTIFSVLVQLVGKLFNLDNVTAFGEKMTEIGNNWMKSGFGNMAAGVGIDINTPSPSTAGKISNSTKGSYSPYVSKNAPPTKGKTIMEQLTGGTFAGGVGGGDTTVHTHIHLEGKQIADVVTKHQSNQKSRKGTQ